jgi:hypothetical protein
LLPLVCQIANQQNVLDEKQIALDQKIDNIDGMYQI